MGEEQDGLAEAVGLFNAGRYFEAHEVLERLWLAAEGLDRELYQGVLQVAVGLHHEAHGNRKGAASMLAKGVSRLARSRPRTWASTWPAYSPTCAPSKPRRMRGGLRRCGCFPNPSTGYSRGGAYNRRTPWRASSP